MHEILPLVLGIVVLIILLVLFAKRIRVAYPILLVVAGLGISFIPGLPKLKIDPDLIFFLFLPPLLFEAAWAISIKELKRWYRIIGSFAFLVVFFTAFAVAFFTNYLIPGFTLALGFLLGGIVSPPDAVSTGAILKFVKVPKATSSILEGESLLNDASSLIIVRFALVAVGTGQFIWSEAILTFGWMAIGGSIIGLALGWIFMKLNKFLPTDAHSDVVLSLVQPYIMYLVAEQLNSSGVLAVVFGGLYLSSHRFSYLNSSSRIGGYNVWESFVFLLNGLIFMLIGLGLPEIIEGIRENGIPLSTAIKYGVWVTGILILVRIISSYLAVVATLIFRRGVVHFGRQSLWFPIIMGWTGMRGVVSLAAALAIPETINGIPFPHRSLILFITFVVILLTLIVQGLTLPLLLKWVTFPVPEEAKVDRDKELRNDLLSFSLKTVRTEYADHLNENIMFQRIAEHWEEKIAMTDEHQLSPLQRKAYIDFLDKQRRFLLEKNLDPNLNEDLVRRELFLIDMEEERLKRR